MSTDSPASRELAAAMATELAQLLNAVPASRRVLAHLAVLEQALKLHGLGGLTMLPEAVLVKAHAQLAGLPLQPQHVALGKLLGLLDLSTESAHQAAQESAHSRDNHPFNAFLSSFMTEEKLGVSEASHSDFMRALDGGDPKAPT